MKVNKKIGYCAAFVAGLAMPAWAADVTTYNPSFEPLVRDVANWGYIDLGGALLWGDETAETYEESWDGRQFYGKVAYSWALSPNYSFQLDASADTYREDVSGVSLIPYEFTRSGSSWSVMGHLTRNLENGHRFGVFADLGGSFDNNNIFAAIGLEGQANYGPWSFYGNFGGDFGIGGDAADVDSQAIFAKGQATYYFNPNFALSAFVGGYSENWAAGDNQQVSWGALAEYKFTEKPVSVYLEYDGVAFSGSNNFDSWDGTTATVWAGLRFHFQDGTLQQINQNTF